MGNAHRLAWIDSQIRSGAYPNATTVAARFEISRRQAGRDIEYLRYSMGAPIEYSASHNGYHYTDQAFTLPSLIVSDPERSALAFLAESYSSIEGEAAERVAAVLRRLTTQAVTAAGEPAPILAVPSAAVDASTVLRRAMETHRKVVTRYRNTDGAVVGRTIWPYAVVARSGALNCIGYCEELGLTHNFALFRFERVELTTEEFEVPAHVRPSHWSRPTAPPHPFAALVQLEDPADAERIEDAVLLNDDGLVRIEFLDSRSMLSVLLSCPSNFEVISPAWLRTRVATRLETLTALHLAPRAGPTAPSQRADRCRG